MKSFLAVFMILGAQNIFATNTPDVLWTKTYGGQYRDKGRAVLQIADGGYIICGYSCSFNVSGYKDVLLIKTDSIGDTLWIKTYGATSHETGYSVKPTMDNGYILCYYNSSSIGLIKTDSSGNEQWNKTYLSGGGTIGDAKQTMDGGYIICSNTNTANSDVVLIKTDSNGDTLWTRTYVNAGTNYGYSVFQTMNNGYIVCSGTANNIWIVRTNVSGDTLWTRIFSGTGYNMQKTTDGGYIICGGLNNNIGLIKIDSSGNEQWSDTLAGSYANSVQQTKDGGYITCGVNGFDAYLVKTDSAGIMQWAKAFNDTAESEWMAVQQTKDNGYILCGYTNPNGVSDVLLMKTGAEVPIEETGGKDFAFPQIKISPNPFFQKAVIKYQLSKKNHVSLIICDITGRIVKTLVNEQKSAGNYTATINEKELRTGIYFVKLISGGYKEAKKLVLLK
ncbi:MAG: T9SS type A sorting domain-containing protein [bacterium]